MKALIVFESMFGNTEAIARAIAGGLDSVGTETVVRGIREVEPAAIGAYDVLVVGAPTHALSLSRPTTRADAVRQGAAPERSDLGLREWLALVHAREHGVRPVVAVFDTKVEKARHWPGSAARRATRAVRSSGLPVLDRPTSFYVRDTTGPLLPGEETRARIWGRHLADLATEAHTGVS